MKIKSQFLLQNNTLSNTNGASQEITVTKPETSTIPDIELTQERVNEVVKQYAEKKQKVGNRQLYATLTSSNLILKGNTITIELNNEVQKELLLAIKQDMLDEFRRLLSNKQSQLDIRVSEIQGEVKAYKPSDKFKLMADKNPALLELKRRFDLDLEY